MKQMFFGVFACPVPEGFNGTVADANRFIAEAIAKKLDANGGVVFDIKEESKKGITDTNPLVFSHILCQDLNGCFSVSLETGQPVMAPLIHEFSREKMFLISQPAGDMVALKRTDLLDKEMEQYK
jgi:hypothetical protein